MTDVHLDDSNYGIKKKFIAPSKHPPSKFRDEAKVTFHYVVRLCDDDHTVIDDSRKDNGKPMELIMGHSFKIESWEVCLKSMGVGEVSSFTVDKSLLFSFPMAMKQLRDIRAGKPVTKTSICCGGLQNLQLGYDDLDKLLKEPQDLEFIFELLTYTDQEDYERENWTLNSSEKEALIPRLKEQGNELYKCGCNKEAGAKYEEALDILENLTLKEKPREVEWIKLDNQKIPFFLNLSQCQLNIGNYYKAITFASEVLDREPDNVKALFRRAKANVGAWNPKEARADFERVAKLDSSLEKTVRIQLAKLTQLEKEKTDEDKKRLEGKLLGSI
ncbi:DgyrCDS6725 [Dimorphilus gyrociliatus]|uniref:peptidylprolyl isomerase n=1 Tax=Dimorphilus gyrociliatus TaxID=2664684 RepID=A0A7I8VQF9_9ANNE|nr:DgyrCDS6725 [Dimorphilus gyrociliatus]